MARQGAIAYTLGITAVYGMFCLKINKFTCTFLYVLLIGLFITYIGFSEETHPSIMDHKTNWSHHQGYGLLQ